VKKPLLVFLFFILSLHAKNLEVDYSVEFGIIGEVAKIHAKLTQDKKYYFLDANVTVMGSIARSVTRNLKERHISKGHLLKGLLITDMYQMIKSYGEYTSTTIYRVDHKRKKVDKHYRKWKLEKKIRDEKIHLKYYGTDDLMTFFLNLNKHIEDKQKVRNYLFTVVGADKKNGRVDLKIPSRKSTNKMQKLLDKPKEGEWLSNVVMHRKLYNSKKGELMLRMDKRSIVEKAVLKDLLFFGDIRIIRK